MKKNLIVSVILLVYILTFLFLFVKLRGMSSVVLEELAEKNIYYLLGFMFIAGITATLYLMVTANNQKDSMLESTEAEVLSYSPKSSEEKEVQTSSVDRVKAELQTILKEDSSLARKLNTVIAKINHRYEISQALVYAKEKGSTQLVLQATYAYGAENTDSIALLPEEGLTAQAVKDKQPCLIKDIPEGYFKVVSGLGGALPKSLLIIPCVVAEDVKLAFELSSFKEYSKQTFDEMVSVCNYVSESINQ